ECPGDSLNRNVVVCRPHASGCEDIIEVPGALADFAGYQIEVVRNHHYAPTAHTETVELAYQEAGVFVLGLACEDLVSNYNDRRRLLLHSSNISFGGEGRQCWRETSLGLLLPGRLFHDLFTWQEAVLFEMRPS